MKKTLLLLLTAAGIILSAHIICAGEENKMAQDKKILIVYYSKNGHTERVAKDVAAAMHADIEKLIDQKNRSGFFAYLTSGRDAQKKRTTELAPLQKDPANYDLVVLCTPVWAWNITPAIRTYMEMNKSKFKSTAYIITAGGTTADKIIPSCEEITGKKPVSYVGFVGKELADDKLYQTKVAGFIEELKK
jgi:flavodoxin